ncbi:putative N-acetylgalactosaminyl-diphosphoundecaprenol glucuronosyltransferase [Marinobacterium lacunae]|uniref:Putative N-acetylgalactosaminyl-diphosphoundecaprenol glucuronosyltransferase n=1 Tax=Marinobacterium lacunae TaxID=1232683 RepID=A0A081G0D1_9GAMM|nr:glycosyltransferase family A protein [Marinobacterium lacunae]KEA64236.1 putative N-acetylgalactosaminyl-diphosphoundecaprenol glucuronosyltransferase [Marinobacterium lacunae]
MKKVSNITVLTASYNSKLYLRETVVSVSKQTCLPYEHIIIDDCSVDGSYELALELEREFENVRVIRHSENKGFPASLNTGIKESRSEFIGILDSDDIAFPFWLELASDKLETSTKYGLVGGGCVLMTEDGLITGEIKYTSVSGNVTQRIKQGRYLILHPGSVIRKNVIQAIGGYRSNLKSLEDNDMFINLSYVSDLYNLGVPLIYYRRLRGSQSRKTEVFKNKMNEYIHQKVAILSSGLSIEEADSQLTDIVNDLNRLPRLEQLPTGEYEKEMAVSFFNGGKYWLSILYMKDAFKKGQPIKPYIKHIVFSLSPVLIRNMYLRFKNYRRNFCV